MTTVHKKGTNFLIIWSTFFLQPFECVGKGKCASNGMSTKLSLQNSLQQISLSFVWEKKKLCKEFTSDAKLSKDCLLACGWWACPPTGEWAQRISERGNSLGTWAAECSLADRCLPTLNQREWNTAPYSPLITAPIPSRSKVPVWMIRNSSGEEIITRHKLVKGLQEKCGRQQQHEHTTRGSPRHRCHATRRPCQTKRVLGQNAETGAPDLGLYADCECEQPVNRWNSRGDSWNGHGDETKFRHHDQFHGIVLTTNVPFNEC